jgi:hypothetical protein
MRLLILAAAALVGCNAPGKPPVAPTTGVADATPPPAEKDAFEECRAAIAKRFRPSPSWSTTWSSGPADRSPYSDCKAWLDGSPPPASPHPMSDCSDARGAWAGISMQQSIFAHALSDDGMTMMRCHNACTVLRVDNGKVLAKTKPSDSLDGTPVLEWPEPKAAMAKFGLHASSGPWPAKDTFLDWSLSPAGSAITYHLRDRETDARIPLGRFTSKDRYVFPAEPLISKNGRTLILAAEIRPQTQGIDYEDAVVDLPAATALLYLRAAELSQRAAIRERAAKACSAL